MCIHQPPCPGAGDGDRAAARVVAAQPLQGWSLLCNGVVLFDDTGGLLPDGSAVAPRREAGPGTAAGGRRDIRALLSTIAAAQAAGTPLGLQRTTIFGRTARRFRTLM
jgi:hypothetical protein